MTTQDSGTRTVIARFSAPVLRPTGDSVRGLALASVIANAVLVCTGAVVLHARVGERPGPARPLVRADLRVLAGLLAAATALTLAAGTVVTGTGPLAGTVTGSHGRRTTVPRFRFTLQDVTKPHADIGWFIGALAIALAIGLHLTSAHARAARASRILLAGLAAQGAIGYAQYFSHLLAGLVWLHVTMSAVLWILVLRLYLSTRERQPPAAALGAQAGAAPVACNSQAPGVTLGAEKGVR